MSSDIEDLKKVTRAKREEVQQTVDQISERVDETRVFFVAGVIAGVIALFLLNRIIFRRVRRLFRRRCCHCGN